MAVVFSNNATTVLSSNITNSATSIAVQDGSVFPTLSGTDYFYATLQAPGNTKREIVKVTARSGNTLTVTRAVDGSSASAFSANDAFELRLNAAALNDAVNSGTADLELNSFTGDGSEVDFTLSMEALEANTLVYIDGVYQNKTAYSISGYVLTFSAAPDNGAAIEVTTATVAPIQESTDFLLNQFTGDGSDTTFTLSSSPEENQTTVFISGVYQSKSNYSISGTTLTFSTAPPASSSIEVMVARTVVYGIGTPSNDTVSTAKIVDGAVTPAKLSLTYATETFVGTAVSNLVDSSPAALDTLNELAAALGDDPNFATTVTNSIALKAPLASPSFTGDVDTSGLLKVGTNDTEYANNYIRFKPTGAAYIDHSTVGQAINFRVSGSSSLDTNALTINSTGIDVTGRAVVDGLSSSASIVGTSNSNSLGGTTFTSAISTVGLSSSAAITSTSNSNSLGGTSFTSSIDVTGTATMDSLTVSNTTQNDALGIAQVVNTTANDASNSSMTVKNHSGTGQFMQWEHYGMRVGNRITTNNGVGEVVFTQGNDVEKMRLTANGLGIGTSSPVNNSNRTTLGLQGAWGGQLDIMVGSTVHAQFGTDNFSSGQSCRIQSRDGILFKAGGSTERLRIDAYGGLVIKSVNGSTTAGFYGGNIVNGITAVPAGSGTPFVLGRDTGTLRSAHFGGNLKFDSGYGVQFSVAGGTGTSTSGTLDDYEEGTWTPNVGGGGVTWLYNQGVYTKVGRLVTVTFWLQAGSTDSSTGTVSIVGLPFATNSVGRNTAAIRAYNLNNVPSGTHGLIGWTSGNATSVTVNFVTGGMTGGTAINTNVWQHGAEIHFSLTYMTA